MVLDEDVRADVKSAFPSSIPVTTVPELGLSGKDDKYVVEEAVTRKSLIVTANKDFLPEYRDHDWRRGKDGRHFWGLIFLAHTASLSQAEQVRRALKEFDPAADDILSVSADGKVDRERLWPVGTLSPVIRPTKNKRLAR